MKQLKPRDKITQKMTRDGAVEINETQQTAERISSREADSDFSQPDTATAERVMEHLDAAHTRKASKKAVKKAQEAAVLRTSTSRLQFTDEERETPKLQPYIKKSEKAADKLDAAKAALPKQKKLVKERTFEETTGKAKTRLRFEEQEKPIPGGKAHSNPLSHPAQEAGIFVHNKIHSVEKDNSGVEGAHKSEKLAERGARYGTRKLKQGYRSHKLKPYREAAKAEQAAFKANVNFQYHKALQENPQLTSNPFSRFMQKQKIKRQYAKTVKKSGAATAKAAAGASQTAAKKAAAFAGRHPAGVIIAIAALLLFIMVSVGLSSCGAMFSGSMNSVLGTSYTSEDSDLVATEQSYAAMENELQQEIDNIESTHSGYDEYRYDLDTIGHNPHELASYLTALLQSYTPQSAQAELKRLFGLQYTLTLTEEIEIRTTTDEEGKRLLTYPRTDSAFLTDDMGDTAAGIIKLLCGKFSFMAGMDFAPELAKVLNSKKVSDHHAIIPTMELAKTDLAALPESERNILTLAGARLLMATAAVHTFEAVTATFECAGQSFTAKGKTVLYDGWKEIDRRYRAALKNKPETDDADSDTEKTLPPFTEGQTFENPAATVTEHDTTPPKPHNEASLLSAMEHAGSEDTDPDAERKGLGTPATRAAVIEKLVKGGFVERKGKQLLPTKDGINLVCVLPDTLTSPQLTAEWENNLTQIAKGKADPAAFMEGIENMARELVKTYPFLSDDKAQMFKPEREALGSCPRCGSPVYEGKKNYYCSNKECIFTMWKNDRFFEERKVTFTPKIAAALLQSGKVNVKKLYSPKTGKTYDGTIVLADTGGKYVNYRVELPKKK